DHLSDGLKATLENLKAWHTSSGFAAAPTKEIGDRLSGQDQVTPDVLQPVIIKHPVTGQKALYVNETFTTGFEGWTAEESKPLLDYLFQYAIKPVFCYRFSWQPGSLAFWDNRVVQHLAINDYHGHRRLMHRITLKGVSLQA
ncbi:MAG: TauD/TfdA family dioxygenase, partial [Chloroflexota bacterium]